MGLCPISSSLLAQDKKVEFKFGKKIYPITLVASGDSSFYFEGMENGGIMLKQRLIICLWKTLKY